MAGRLRKTVNEQLYLSRAKGGGILRRELWVDDGGRVVRYNLAYINHLIYAGDNGRVLGYDSAHGYHHRHYRGTVTAVAFKSYEEIEGRFQSGWIQIVKEAKRAQN
jgi:hypothetical protein